MASQLMSNRAAVQAHNAHIATVRANQRRADTMVPASRLTQGQKAKVWQHIKAHCPEQLAFLNDPFIQQLVKGQGAVPVFTPELVNAALASEVKAP